MKIFLLLLSIIYQTSTLFSQSEEELLLLMKDTVEDAPQINEYDKYNPILGGKEIRLCDNNLPCNDIIKDYYPNNTLKHKALYVNGQIKNQSKNFFENGQIEREFKSIDQNKSIHTIYYPSGKIRTRIFYYKNKPLKWEDFYSNGNPEYLEEFNKTFEFHHAIKYWYFNGNLSNEMVLIDKKRRIYIYKEYYPNGKIKTEGFKIHNSAMNDYQKFGQWKSYDTNNNIISEENFVKGNVSGEETPKLPNEEEEK